MDKAVTIESAKTLLDYVEQLGPTLVAITAIVFTLLIAKQQIRATTVSVSRRQWIDALREDLSKLVALQVTVRTLGEKQAVEDFHRRIEAFCVHCSRVQLLLKPNDANHSALTEAILKAQEACCESKKDGERADSGAFSAVISAGQEVIAAEWKLVKSGR